MPAGSDVRLYRPELVLTVLVVTPVPTLTALTLAPGTAAPDGSDTVPRTPPAWPWPNSCVPAAAIKANKMRRTKSNFNLIIGVSSPKFAASSATQTELRRLTTQYGLSAYYKMRLLSTYR